MLNISYTISPKLKEYLARIENLRRQILLTPISPQKELRLKWEATFNRTYSCLKLVENPLKKQDMLKLLSEITHRKTNSDQEQVLKFKKALDHISQNWLGSENAVTASGLIEIHRIIGNGRLRVPQAGLQYLLNYLQARLENPIIQAAIVSIEMEKMQLFEEKNKLLSFLAPLVFLYKYGYDFRGFLAYETQFLDAAGPPTDVSLTLWLEYFALCMLRQAELLAQSIEKPKTQIPDLRKSFWELQDRQKSILSYLDSPQATITNRQIQKRYRTSQITASRDLAKLTSLGYLFSHGKGRSVYYTKI